MECGSGQLGDGIATDEGGDVLEESVESRSGERYGGGSDTYGQGDTTIEAPSRSVSSSLLVHRCQLTLRRAMIFGNGLITEGVAKSPDYAKFCIGFPSLHAIRHAGTYDFYAVDHIPNPPLRFHSLDSLDVCLPSALLEDIPEEVSVQPVSVDSLTLRSNEEFMLHLPGPFTNCKPDWLHNVVRQVKDVRQLNLHMALEDDMDRSSPYYSRLPQYDPFPGFWPQDFPDLREVNVYFVTRYRSDVDNPCDLVSLLPSLIRQTVYRLDIIAATLPTLLDTLHADDSSHPLFRAVS